MEYRSGQYEFRITDATAGIVEAHVNQLEVVDSYESAFANGAWDRSIAKYGKLPRVLVDHEGRVAGKVIETRQEKTASGIYQRAKLQYNLRNQYGTEAFHDVEDGYYDEFSVGFVPEKQHYEQRDGQRVRVIEDVRWYEVSQVLSGASPGTSTLAVRSAIAELLTPTADVTAPEQALSALALSTRAGARNAAADLKRIQSMHDLAAELGASSNDGCMGNSEPDADDTKRNSILLRAWRLKLQGMGIEV